ncbi:hypothetical protein ACFU99_03850 [Streptomyces sp. NPDC057654]|uniref:hypothetical protein n=1 Tax=Streptomyces sp. NPDC057654 TaxID=3346196 RepID=UPI00367CE76E
MKRPPHPCGPADAAHTSLGTTPYEMRPATREDRTAVAALIDERIVHPSTPECADLDADRSALLNRLGGEERGEPLVWLLCEDEVIVGCALVRSATPEGGWSSVQRAEPALFISALFTRPAPGVLTGRLLAWALLDYAARLPAKDGSVLWVRGATSSETVMRYARDVAGWAVADTVLHHHRHVHLLQRPAEQVPGLRAMVSPRRAT